MAIAPLESLLDKVGVAKMTLYNHFGTKEDLIVAVLEKRSGKLQSAVDHAIAQAGRSPTARHAAIFEGLKSWFATDEFNGCAFIRALSKYPKPDHPIHRAAWRHKRGMNSRVRTIAESAGARDPERLADTISLLIDGAIVAAHATSSIDPADDARLAAANLLKLATA